MTPMQYNRTKYNFIFYGLIFIFVICGFHGKALAHRVTIFAWVDGNTVYTQSRFSGGKAVQNGRISVYDSQEKLLLTGNTDSAGEFDFNLPRAADIRIVLDAGMGHGNEWVLSAEDVEFDSGKGDASGKKLTSHPPDSKAVSTKLTKPIPPISIPLTRDEIKEIIDESIDKKLKPMMKLLAESQDDNPSFNDILSGIGYILGLVGLGAYIHYRKKR
ncbi:MAG: hypothetical protein U9Q05_02495 [Thermodesulfobacteriota bacterium]|nr:hypothetical protein [Thermodesulfobacteriota bacterium]